MSNELKLGSIEWMEQKLRAETSRDEAWKMLGRFREAGFVKDYETDEYLRSVADRQATKKEARRFWRKQHKQNRVDRFYRLHMTQAQRNYMAELCAELGEQHPTDITSKNKLDAWFKQARQRARKIRKQKSHEERYQRWIARQVEAQGAHMRAICRE